MIIRNIKIEDAEQFLTMMLALDNETKMMMLEPGERATDLNAIELMIKNRLDHSNFFMIAEHNNELVGFMTADRGQCNRIKHSAYIVIGIREKHRGLGIGTKFFDELDKWALENSITRLELTVVTSNQPALHLYQKFGFTIEGTKKNSMVVDGTYVDEYYMAKLLK